VCSIAAIILGLLLIVTEDRMTILVAGVITTFIGLISLGLDMVIWRSEDAKFAPVGEHFEKNKWRELTEEQRTCLVSELRENQILQNQVLVSIEYLNGNTEAMNFAELLREIFVEAGWRCDSTFLMGNERGIKILYNSPKSVAPHEVITTAFTNAGIRYEITSGSEKFGKYFGDLVKIEIWAKESPPAQTG
jgi:hypothetical protein